MDDYRLRLEGLEPFAPDDRCRIAATLAARFSGFAAGDVSLLGDVYAEDADWIDASGVRRTGAGAIVAYLLSVFAATAFRQCSMVSPTLGRVRRLTADAVVVSSEVLLGRPGIVGGMVILEHRRESLHVLQRHSDGGWRIVSEMTMEARAGQAVQREALAPAAA